ncbi:spermatogenesis-associated protein 5-like [Elysia marginata]|uniref:Spermatogenesis-associated protein 5-like n=1 Tax=Elysia marginata TaxID=1093978 RepID=A0AAV4EFE7_9GAST|nr:spermatogenesis-associated protein 5-like [Elysia marginata]
MLISALENNLIAMAPNKKKDKGKPLEWLQCSLSGKLISPEDAEAHSKSGATDIGYIQDKVLHGKVINAENLLGEDGVSVTKSIRDQDSVVWLAVQTMQVCGLAIGQPCVVNKVLMKRAWPLKSLPLSGIALSKVSREELGVSKDSFVFVERFVPNERLVVESAKLILREDNPVFETKEFAAFAAAYLDGKFICEGSPLLIRYFGQTCHCSVNDLRYGQTTPVVEMSSPPVVPTPSGSTPLKNDGHATESSVCSTPVSHRDTSFQPETPNQDLSDSIASLNISSTAHSPSVSSTPSTPLHFQRENYPNLHTPIKDVKDCRVPLPNVFARVSSQETVFTVEGPGSEKSSQEIETGQASRQISLDDIGGLSVQIEELRARIGRALNTNSSSRCLLLYGPAGTGKSLLVKALMADLCLPTQVVTGTDIWSKLFGEAESNLRKVFKTAQDRAPSLIVIDDIDVICPKLSQNSSGQQEHRIIGTLLSLVDSISSMKNSSGSVAVLGITNNREALDPALRRAGRFSYEIEIGVPTAPQRFEILQSLLRHVAHGLSESQISTVAGNAHGYVGADLAALVNEASMHAVIKRKSQGSMEQQMTLVTIDDLVYAGLHVKPSALREIQLEIPQVKWSDIGGMCEVKTRLREAVELPLSHPEIFKNLGIEPPRGLLMYGPPGCSKTMVARALATECKLNFLAVKGPELFNQYVGESEKAIREVFRKARSAAPSVIFFDEIDAIAAKRGSSSGGSGVDDRVLTQLLTEMDGLEFLKDVFIMAATNRPDKIDNALLRPGRFDSLVYVPLPDADTRLEILQKKFERMAVAETVCLEKLVEATEGYSGAEVVQVCQEAAMYALRQDLQATTVEQHHFEAALQKVTPQINQELLGVYNKFMQSTIK